MTLFPQRTIGAFLIAVLAAVPVSGPLCSALCALAALSETAADHGGHGDASACHDLIGDGAVVSGASGHDCTRHHGLAGDSLASVSATRADVGLIGLVQHLAPSVPHGMLGLVALNMRSRPGAPNASPPPIRTPLVLRI